VLSVELRLGCHHEACRWRHRARDTGYYYMNATDSTSISQLRLDIYPNIVGSTEGYVLVLKPRLPVRLAMTVCVDCMG
jgi:hypothetical protein